MRARWMKWLAVPVMILMGFVWLNEGVSNVYADETDDEMIPYFNIEINATTTEKDCDGVTDTVFLSADGAPAYIEQGGESCPEKVTTQTYTAEISSQYKHALVNGAMAATFENENKNVLVNVKFSISNNKDKNKLNMSIVKDGVVVNHLLKDIETRNKTIKKIRSKVENSLKKAGPVIVEHLDRKVEYTFKVGDIQERKAANSTGNSNGPEATCQNSGGLGTLGWVLCPALDIMNGATDQMYNALLKPALQVDPQLFTDKGDATRGGWETFRNIANILFIILFLVVIFSQLTGIGIDNYGIKKILPKMILAAILINLSYWICIVFVDLSNILGNAFQAMFDGLPTGNNGLSVDMSSLRDQDNNPGKVIDVSGILISAGILAALLGGGWAIFSNPAIMATLFISALGVFIAILFLFVLLAAREAAIVVLVVLSPLVIVCYMLPNTKTLFDKWWKFLKALLLVYPIAGLLIGGGNYVSKLLLTIGQGDSGVFAAFTAMIVGIVPIFFIPTVLRNAFSAMGNIGARISGIGQRVSGAATGAARNSQAYKNAQERGLERRTRIRAGLDENGNERNIGRLGTFMRGGKRNIARNKAQYLSNLAAERQRENMLSGGFAATQAGIEARAEAELVQNEEALIMGNTDLRDNIGELQNGLEEAIASGESSKIMAYQNVLSRKGDAGREAVRQAMVNAQSNDRVHDGADRVYASNLMNNWASDYKDNNRSTYDYANEVLGGNNATLNQNSSAGIGSLKTSQVANMDDGEFERLKAQHVQYDNQGNITHVDDDFAELCYNTLQDTNATTGAKESRLSDIRSFARESQSHQQQMAQQQATQQAQQQQQQMAQNLQDINDLLSQHGNGNGTS